MENKKIRVLAVPSDNGGCRYWRIERPHLKLNELFGDEFDTVINGNVNWEDTEYISSFDIVVIHKGFYDEPKHTNFLKALDYCKGNNIVTVVDVDDYWELGQFHPMNSQSRTMHIPQKAIEIIGKADYVTTTTSIFADEISKFNKNVFVFPNAVDTNDPQWAPDFSKKDRIRFGFVMGSSHERDMELFQGTVNQLPQEIREKMQIVLCGYDLRGTVSVIGKDGQIQSTHNIKPTDTVWYRYEQNVTDKFKLCSPKYANFLHTFMFGTQYPNVDDEFYRREWTKGLTSFGNHYNNIDVLLVPLNVQGFNKYKSELKIVEAGFKHKAIVMSNFGPYTIGTKSMFKKGGEIDMTGNCVLIEPGTDHKAWAKAIKKLVTNPELITTLADNLHEHVKDTYNLDTVTKNRAEFYKKINKK